MRYHGTLVARFASKLVLDILPATAASLIGGFVFTHYGVGRIPEAAAQVKPASAEMMQLLRDEHGVIVSFVNAQLDREKAERAAEDAIHRTSGEVAATANPPARTLPAAIAAKPAPAHTRMAVAPASAALATPAIAQVQQVDSPGAPSPAPQLLLAKTAGLKDHVVSVTHRVVSTLGGIPGWIGNHFGGTDPRPRPAADMVTAS